MNSNNSTLSSDPEQPETHEVLEKPGSNKVSTHNRESHVEKSNQETTEAWANDEMIEVSLNTTPVEYTSFELELIEELIEYAKDGDLANFRKMCQRIASLKHSKVRPDSCGFMDWTPAHWAAREGHLNILKFLVEIRANLYVLDKKGDTLLHKAATNGQYKVCVWLLEKSFNVNTKNFNGLTALELAQREHDINKSTGTAFCITILKNESENTF